VVGLLASLRSVDRIVHFTQFQNGQMQLVVYSFFSMVMFGAIYYILPRLVGCEWLSSSMISLHFWGAAYGGSLLVFTLLIGGLLTGTALNDTEITYFSIAMDTSGLLNLGRIGAWLLIGAGHLIFGLHFLLMLLRIGQPGGEPTLFAPIGEEEKH
jgi:cytochrome c oxidase cbb3-type subunit 1